MRLVPARSRRWLAWLGVLLLAVVTLPLLLAALPGILSPLPPLAAAPPRRLPGASFQGPQGLSTLAGAVHVHTQDASRDSRISLEEAVEAAREAGLGFLVVTNHDALPKPPAWHGDVLVMFGTEWSPKDGHLLDLSEQPGPTTGFANSSVALSSCLERGGPCIASHPTSRRRPFLGPLPDVPALEVHGAMTSLGDLVEPRLPSLWTALQLFVNPRRGFLRLGAVDDSALALMEGVMANQPLMLACGADAHGIVSLKDNFLAYTTLLDGQEPLSTNAVGAAAQIRARLFHAACVNMEGGRVDGLMLRNGVGVMEAVAAIRGAVGPARLELWHQKKLVAVQPLQDGVNGRATAPLLRGAWRAVVRVETPAFGPGTSRIVAVRLLHMF